MAKIHYLFLLLVGVVLCSALVLMTEPSHRAQLVGSDFRAIFTGPYMVRGGAGQQLYDLSAQFFWQRALASEVSSYGALMPFLNPAFVALFLLPFTLLSFPWAYVAWGLVNVAALCVFFAWCFRLFRTELAEKKIEATPLFLLIFSWVPFWVAIMQGQFSLVLLLALCASWSAYERKRYVSSGVWLALLFIRPHLVLIPAALLLLGKQYRVVRGLVAGVVGLLLVGLSIGGAYGLTAYAKILLLIGRGGEAFGTHPSFEPTLKSALHVLYGTNHVTWGIGVLWLTVCAVVFLYLYWRQKTVVFSPFIQWALMPLLAILFSPHTNYHDLSLIFFAELLVLKYIVLPQQSGQQVGSRATFWSYVFIGLQMAALSALLPLSAVMACLLLVCTLYLLYFEYRQVGAVGVLGAKKQALP